MTYPPPQQPGQFGQSSYQGLGSFSGGQGEPPKRNTGRIIAIVVIAVMVLGGGGVATYFLTRGGDNPSDSTSAEKSNDDGGKNTSSDNRPSDDASSDRDQDSGGSGGDSDNSGDSDASNSPEDVRDDYMAAYENKDFADVVDDACAAYKTKFGVDTSELEEQLEPYDITATPDGDAEVDDKHPDTASAKIDLSLVGEDETQEPKILIKIVQERGKWRFCGEGTA